MTHPARPFPRCPHEWRRALGAAALASVAPFAVAQSGATERFTGELGVGVFAAQSTVRGYDTTTMVMPYVYGQYGRLFGRVDTFGVQLVPLGNGHLEAVARFSTEGFKADRAPLTGLRNRANPTPLGLGTAQRLPGGMLFLYALHDPASGGALVEATFGTRLQVGPLKLYPQLGVEHRTRAYVDHLYGVSAAEAAATGRRAYAAPASTVPMSGLAASLPLGGAWSAEAQWRYLWLDSAIKASPLAARTGQHRAYLVLTHRFD